MRQGGTLKSIDLNWLLLLTSTVLPQATAVITNRWAASGVKANVLALLSAGSGFLLAFQGVGGVWSAFDWNHAAADAVTTFLVAGGLHTWLLEPKGVTGKDGAWAQAIPGGIGTPVPDETLPAGY
jgi:hypothetical protein